MIKKTSLFLLLMPFIAFGQNFKIESKDTLNAKPKNSIVFSGYINSIYNYDFVGTASKYPAMNIVSVPVGNVLREPSMSFVIFQTRLRFKSAHQTKLGTIRVKFEADFVNSANAFRIRHALISIRKWDFGQTWSNLSDEDAWPNITDYDGPPTGVWARPVMIRYNAIQGKKHSLSLSIEGPSLEYQAIHIIDTIVSTAHQDFPDFIARYRYVRENMHFQIGGVFRNIKYKNTLDSTFNYKQGYGISASTGITIFKRDLLHIQATAGIGISRYLVGLEGYKWDAIPTGNGDIQLLPAMGGFFGYDHFWNKNKKFSSTIVLGYINIKNNNILPTPADFMTGYWGAINLYYYPVENLKFALEYVTAYREDTFEQTGQGERIQLLVQYDF